MDIRLIEIIDPFGVIVWITRKAQIRHVNILKKKNYADMQGVLLNYPRHITWKQTTTGEVIVQGKLEKGTLTEHQHDS